MCRFVAYLGLPILIEEVLFETKNSLIKQSMKARESEIVLNGDGFGLGWYNHDIDPTPGVYKSILPAWNDENLKSISAKLRSTCFFAHVRAASTGSLSHHNCHPFVYGSFMFMHNGEIAGFHKIKREMRRELSDEIYNWILGDTDSEHFAALVFEYMNRNRGLTTIETMANAIEQAIGFVQHLQSKYKITEPNYIAAVLTSGKALIAIRFVDDPGSKPSSLHYALGAEYAAEHGGFVVRKDKKQADSTIFVTSERLDSHKANWAEVQANHFLLVNGLSEIMQRPVKVAHKRMAKGGKKGFKIRAK